MRSALWALAFVALIGGGAIMAALLRNDLPWETPPGPAIRLQRYLTGNVAETLPGSPFPELLPRRYADVTPEELFGFVEHAVPKITRVQVLERDPKQRVLRLMRTTSLFGFRDDLAIRVTGDPEGRGAVLFLRSESRAGQADFGANIRNVLDIYAAIDAVVPPPPDAPYKAPPAAEPLLF